MSRLPNSAVGRVNTAASDIGFEDLLEGAVGRDAVERRNMELSSWGHGPIEAQRTLVATRCITIRRPRDRPEFDSGHRNE